MALAVSGTEVSQGYASPATELALTAPTRVAGDGLVVDVWLESNSITPSTPAGWTLLGSSVSGTALKLWWFGRIADNTTTDNFKSTFTSTGRIGAMRRITGEPATVASWVIGAANSGTSEEAKLKAALGSAAGSLALGLWMTAVANTVSSVTSGWTNSGELGPLVSKTIGAESTGEPVVAFTTSQTWASLMVVVPPSAPEAAPHRLALLGVGS